MSTAALFNSILHAELNAYAAWLPVTNTFKLGNYGLISNGVFTPIGNITEFGIVFAEEQGPPATLDLTSVTLAGVSVPKSILQELVTFYSRTPATPQGINLDDPFPLPAGIRRIDVGKGQATVIQ